MPSLKWRVILQKSMTGGGSKRAIYAALFGNLGIAISKLVAAILTVSTSIWTETYHSFSDTFNQVLLLIGIRTSKKQVSEKSIRTWKRTVFLVFYCGHTYLWYFWSNAFRTRI